MHLAEAISFPHISRIHVSYFTLSDIFEWHWQSLGETPTIHSITDRLAPIDNWDIPSPRGTHYLRGTVFIPTLFTFLFTMEDHLILELNLLLGLHLVVAVFPLDNSCFHQLSCLLYSIRGFVACFIICRIVPKPFTALVTFPWLFSSL